MERDILKARKCLDEFLDKWPPERVTNMSLDEYVSVEDHDTFCYWVERRTRPLGSIHGNTSEKFGVFRRADPEERKGKFLHDDVYSWRKVKGANLTSADQAFRKIHQELLLVIEAATNGEFEKIDYHGMLIAYAIPEESCPQSCFSQEEIECLESQIEQLEGKTEKLKNPYTSSDLKRYIWAIARLGGWKGYLSERKPGITTFWMGLQKFTAVMQGWILFRNVSTR
ncbi:Transposase Tn5 dimerisation domain-containing protein [Chitinophaga sp. CF118]|uniref:hypothetical protein n=1 Tax=Chitinophaga sp. CF118 TaxID=1884367 RepID=UPI0008EE0A72|nr:hypothetical protein [Chitinophaga sp. CF118]SFE40061.1 Transposase Tn5 dimerisation domain-containing protein [Chitinophaga sp. CF118]